MNLIPCKPALLPANDTGVSVEAKALLKPYSPESGDYRDLARVWDGLVRGRLRVIGEDFSDDSVRVIAEGSSRRQALQPDEASLAENILCGRARKALASDFGIAVSTTTGRYLRALDKLDLRDSTMPLPLVLAAQSHAGLVHLTSCCTTHLDHEGRVRLSVSVPRPLADCLTELTPVQQLVAQWLIEGCTRGTIAARRSTSLHTVAGQVHAVFRALRVTGRFALIRKACELGCFRQPVMSVA